MGEIEEKTDMEMKTSGKVETVEQEVVEEPIKAFKRFNICSGESKKETTKRYNIVADKKTKISSPIKSAGAKRKMSDEEEIGAIFRKLRVVGEVREEGKIIGGPGPFY